MSFSSEVKEELSKHVNTARHCQIAELAAIISICGRVACTGKNKIILEIHTENLQVARKYFTLIKKVFNISNEITVKRNVNVKKSRTYLLAVKQQGMAEKIFHTVKLDTAREISAGELPPSNALVFQNTCCKRAFIRGSFLASGSISDPNKGYHFEIVVSTEEKAVQIQKVIRTFSLDAKIVIRKKYYVVYIKEGSQIVDLLNIMEAHVALMNLENVRILKEMRNSINRQVNCETANINKTVTAASKQVEDILYIENKMGFSNLSKGLEEIARLRLEQPEASLKELGGMLNPPIGKSGVNHRLKKLGSIAEQLRNQKEDM